MTMFHTDNAFFFLTATKLDTQCSVITAPRSNQEISKIKYSEPSKTGLAARPHISL